MKQVLSVLIVCGAFLCSAGKAQDLLMPISADSVQMVSRAVVDAKHCDDLLVWKKYDPSIISGVAYPLGYQAVLELDDLRYTIYVSNDTGRPDSTNNGLISFWSRPIGTRSAHDLITWSDKRFDGSVDFIHNGRTWYDAVEGGPIPPLDLINEYQERHNETIRKLVRFFYRE
ncbi:MAG: hypothetical protein WC289_05760 [Patescibacteria group bacterium]|jgi:hypothetical protein